MTDLQPELKTMTEEEALALVGDGVAKFSSYYKYSFYFSADTDTYSAIVTVGGCSDDIYKYDVGPNSTEGIEYAIKYGIASVERKSDGAKFSVYR